MYTKHSRLNKIGRYHNSRHITVSLHVTLAVGDVRGLSKISRDRLADGANVREVPVRRLVRVVDGAQRLQRHQRLRVQQAGRGAGRHVVVAVEVARVDVTQRRLRVREPGLVQHGHVLQRGVVRRVPSTLGLPALPVALALRARRAPLGLTLPVYTHFSMMRSGHLQVIMKLGHEVIKEQEV